MLDYMRIARCVQLFLEVSGVHSMWRCHNKEFLLVSDKIKHLLLQCLKECFVRYPQFKEYIKIHSYCVMNNHFHQNITYSGGSSRLSNFMRNFHTLFGIRFNKETGRSGKFADSRPKTPLIENAESEMYVQFYIDANPIQAGICNLENLHLYKFSTYKFYAHGIKDDYSDILSIPDWYNELGSSPDLRQKKYRKLFCEFLLNKSKYTNIKTLIKRKYIGNSMWISAMNCILVKMTDEKKQADRAKDTC